VRLLSLKSFRFALRGLWRSAQQEPNFRFELAVAAVVLAGAVWLGFRGASLAFVLLATGVVLAGELFNTVLERLLDLLEPRLNRLAGELKDTSAAAVLVLALAAVLAAVAIFLG